jgi:pimeloyl-ACP methyl ester carboxylesterase
MKSRLNRRRGAKMPTVKVGDINIYYEIHGEGEPLVLIMGLAANSGQWFRQIPGLSQEYRVVAFDNRGTGQTDKPDIPYSMEMLSQDVSGLLDALDIDAAHVCGHSMGGMIAQDFALRYPERVISLILGATSCGGTHAIMPDAGVLAVLFDEERRQRLTPEEAVREALPFMCSQEFIDTNPDIVEQFIVKVAENMTPQHVYVRQAEAAMGHDTYDRLPQIRVPTLVICGTADRFSPLGNSRLLAARIPNTELVILENMGHGFFIEAAEEANKAILDFLRRHPKE